MRRRQAELLEVYSLPWRRTVAVVAVVPVVRRRREKEADEAKAEAEGLEEGRVREPLQPERLSRPT